MPKRTRLSQKSKKPSKHRLQKNNSQFDDDQDPPSEAEWALMAPYASFVGITPSLSLEFSMCISLNFFSFIFFPSIGWWFNLYIKSMMPMGRSIRLARKISTFHFYSHYGAWQFLKCFVCE